MVEPMIKLFGRLFWNIVRTRLAGPEKANRPILVLVEDAREEVAEDNPYAKIP